MAGPISASTTASNRTEQRIRYAVSEDPRRAILGRGAGRNADRAVLQGRKRAPDQAALGAAKPALAGLLMEFEWDAVKAASNFDKHGVSFAEADDRIWRSSGGGDSGPGSLRGVPLRRHGALRKGSGPGGDVY
jgi:hypothetical protein